MPELVYRKILHAAETSQAIVGERTGPHQFAHGIIILRILYSNTSLGDDGAQKCLSNSIGQFVF